MTARFSLVSAVYMQLGWAHERCRIFDVSLSLYDGHACTPVRLTCVRVQSVSSFTHERKYPQSWARLSLINSIARVRLPNFWGFLSRPPWPYGLGIDRCKVSYSIFSCTRASSDLNTILSLEIFLLCNAYTYSIFVMESVALYIARHTYRVWFF